MNVVPADLDTSTGPGELHRAIAAMDRRTDELRRQRELLERLEDASSALERLRALEPLVERLERYGAVILSLERNLNLQELVDLLKRAELYQ